MCLTHLHFTIPNIQPCNYQVSKEVIHELEFGDIAVMIIYIICSRVTGIFILIGSLGCLKEVKTIDMILGKCKFPNRFFLIFYDICCRYTLDCLNEAIPMCTYNICLFNKLVFHHKLFLNTFSTTFMSM